MDSYLLFNFKCKAAADTFAKVPSFPDDNICSQQLFTKCKKSNFDCTICFYNEYYGNYNVQGVPLPFFLFQKLISQRPKQLGEKFQQFSVFHEVPFHMRKNFFFENF